MRSDRDSTFCTGTLRRRFAGGTCLLLLVVTGCWSGSPKRLPAPRIEPEAIARTILQRADADHDGYLDGDELLECPGLNSILTPLDRDRDSRLSAAEIDRWLTFVKESRVAVGPGGFTVTQGGKPLAGVHVRMVPEAFMGGEMKAAEGTTEPDGFVNPTIPGSPHHGVNYGLYRVQLTGEGLHGQPLPPKYNTETTLGVGIGPFENGYFTPTVSIE